MSYFQENKILMWIWIWILQYLCSNWKFKSSQMELSLVLQIFSFNIEHPLYALHCANF